jgi:uncharacterized protein (TIGR03083 family)
MLMPPIFVVDAFPALSRRLLELLRSLAPAEWHLPTVSSRRTVKDIASHLLDGSLRRLSMQRDGYRAVQPLGSESLVDFLNRLNDEWEVAMRRLSPQVLVALICWADEQLAALFRSLDPYGPAIFPVAWAGEEQSANWMDIAREFTEKWHHTQQIFTATGRPSTIMTRELGSLCLDIFMRALPFTFGGVAAEPGATVAVSVAGEAGGSWYIEKRAQGWEQVPEPPRSSTATVVMSQDTAWKLVTKHRSREAIRREFPDIQVTGDEALGAHVLDMVSVTA